MASYCSELDKYLPPVLQNLVEENLEPDIWYQKIRGGMDPSETDIDKLLEYLEYFAETEPNIMWDVMGRLPPKYDLNKFISRAVALDKVSLVEYLLKSSYIDKAIRQHVILTSGQTIFARRFFLTEYIRVAVEHRNQDIIRLLMSYDVPISKVIDDAIEKDEVDTIEYLIEEIEI